MPCHKATAVLAQPGKRISTKMATKMGKRTRAVIRSLIKSSVSRCVAMTALGSATATKQATTAKTSGNMVCKGLAVLLSELKYSNWVGSQKQVLGMTVALTMAELRL